MFQYISFHRIIHFLVNCKLNDCISSTLDTLRFTLTLPSTILFRTHSYCKNHIKKTLTCSFLRNVISFLVFNFILHAVRGHLSPNYLYVMRYTTIIRCKYVYQTIAFPSLVLRDNRNTILHYD